MYYMKGSGSTTLVYSNKVVMRFKGSRHPLGFGGKYESFLRLITFAGVVTSALQEWTGPVMRAPGRFLRKVIVRSWEICEVKEGKSKSSRDHHHQTLTAKEAEPDKCQQKRLWWQRQQGCRIGQTPGASSVPDDPEAGKYLGMGLPEEAGERRSASKTKHIWQGRLSEIIGDRKELS